MTIKDNLALMACDAQGMARATAEEFPRRGAICVMVDINAEKLASVLEAVQTIDGRAKSVLMNVSLKDA